MPRAFVKKCRRCQTPGDEYFKYLDEYEFDVDKARRIVHDGRKPVELEEESVRHCVDTNRIHKRHVPHVDIKHPGIIAFAFGKKPNGRWTKWHVLIDGNHRAARCLKENKPFFAYLLSEKESKEILMKGPGKMSRGTAAGSPAKRRRKIP